MKRFNVDELIWFIIQLLLVIMMIYLKRSGQIVNFISDKMIIYYNIAIIIIMIYAISQIPKIFTIRSRNSVANKFLPLTFVIIVSTVFLYILPNYKALKSSVLNNTGYTAEQDSNILKIDNNNYMLLEEIEGKKEQYYNKVIQFEGFIYKGDGKDNSDIVLGREVVSCCQSDKSLIEVRAKGIDNTEKGKWMRVIGKIKYDTTWYLEIMQYMEINEPVNIYFNKRL